MIILSGASRTGKGLIAHELMSVLNMPYLSIDPVKMALARSVPAYPLDTNGGSIKVPEQLWPFVSTLILNMIETGVDYIIEGEILPWQVNELRQSGAALKSCFVGYADISVDEKFDQVRTHCGHPNDWSSELSDTELRQHLEESIAFSRYLRRECQQFDLHYQDFSGDYLAAKSAVIQRLTA